MSRRDQTGPMGEGPMTGRGMGNCNNNDSRRPMRNFGVKRNGLGNGLGRGLGLRRRDK